MIKSGMVSTTYLSKREDRTMPYIVSIIFFYLTYYLLKTIADITGLLLFHDRGDVAEYPGHGHQFFLEDQQPYGFNRCIGRNDGRAYPIFSALFIFS